MSGIVGVLDLDGAPADRDWLRQATDFLAYRGPDARSVWSDGPIGFGHTLFQTYEDTPTEQQPCSVDGEVWITADARIDAQGDLRALLKSHGRDVHSLATDPELILHAYHAWEERCVEYLLGDFTFAIWDRRAKKLFCARDQFGVKLFYFARVGDAFVFSNTLNAVRRHPAVSDCLNEVAIGDFLLHGYNPELQTTTFADVARLPPAHSLTLSLRDGVVRQRRYWEFPDPKEEIRYRTEREYVEHFREVLGHAVADRLRTRNVGVYMSGGLDSPALALAARDVLATDSRPYDLQAYTAVYDRLIPCQERYYAGLVAEALGIPINFSSGDEYRLFHRFEETGARLPEPIDSPSYAFADDQSRFVASRCRVALYGEDGDALLHPPSLATMWATVGGGRTALDMGRFLMSRRSLPLRGLGLRRAALRSLGKFVDANPAFPEWIDPGYSARVGLRDRYLSTSAPAVSPRCARRPETARRLSSSYWQTLTEGLDPGTTGVALETRLPLLDLRVIAYVISIPALPWCQRKELLRAYLRGVVPTSVVERPKTPLWGYFEARFAEARCEEPVRAKWSARVSEYIDTSMVPLTVPAGDPDLVSIHLRPRSLSLWLDGQCGCSDES